MIKAPLIDSHCHLNQLDLEAFDGDLNQALDEARKVGVQHFLSVCITPNDIQSLVSLATQHQDITMSVGVHPNEVIHHALTEDELLAHASTPSCVAIGETGLDYFRTEGETAIQAQQTSFRNHIRVARKLNKPLIIHTRSAAEDTLRILEEEQAQTVGGVMHCFAETYDIAERAMALNFYISFSGIVTFKNAKNLHEVAQKIPLDRMLIETDSPYLAPTPHRGKPNHPAWVLHVAKSISALRNTSYETIAKTTTQNFYNCFKLTSKKGSLHG